MQFSEKWLRELVDVSWSTDELSHQLTMAGLEVDAVVPVAAAFSGVVVAEVVSVEPHPDADKLRVTRVNDGTGEAKQVVCGAANVRAGLKVPFAQLGAELPGGLKIKQAKLRGVESFGMLCASQELGLAEPSDGLLELPADAPVGQSIRDYLNLDDNSFELGITPNRGDCLSLQGLAREVGVLARSTVHAIKAEPVPASHQDARDVVLKAPELCSRYIGRVIKGVDATVATPTWMKQRLERSGIRSISAIVDVTNYVLIELGQPMHAFDLDKVAGGIQVRRAVEGEELELLDGQKIVLRADTLVIADEQSALAVAGVMGGNPSAVGDSTTSILLESAFFDQIGIAGKARSYGLHTDSSHRFERGVDCAGQRAAMERATALILEICGGTAGPVVEAVDQTHLPKRDPVSLRHARVGRLLGFELSRSDIEDFLSRLGMAVTATPEGWSVVPPSWRFDVSIEVDLIEEIGRIYGYNNLPARAPASRIELVARPENRVSEARIKALLVDMGYQEAITYSFIDPRWQAAIDPDLKPLALSNPISTDLSVMRTSLMPGLLKAVLHNQNRQQPRVRLFETGLRFVPEEGGLRQQRMVAGAVAGAALPELWNNSKKDVDFFDIKGNIESVLALGGAFDTVEFKASSRAGLHPGQTAEVLRAGRSVGWMGKLHPRVQAELEISGPVYLFELELEGLSQGSLPRFAELSRFPEVRRDIALLVDERLAAADVMAVVRASAGEELRDTNLFDVYKGPGVEAGKRSLALSLVWQHPERTLQDEEVQSKLDTVIARLKERFNVSLRD